MPASVLADMVDQSLLTSPDLAGFIAMMAAHGSPWQFGVSICDRPHTIE
jgi:hypothetical protein